MMEDGKVGNELQVFKNNEFGQIRVALLNGKPVLNLYDICFNLGYTKKNNEGRIYLAKDRMGLHFIFKMNRRQYLQ
jgi:Prophage antirepressor